MPSASTYSVKLILNTALSLTGLGLIVRAAGALKEIIFARAFGVSVETDAFVLALTYSTFLPTIVGAALSTALIAGLAEGGTSFLGPGLVPLAKRVLAASVACALLIYAFAPVVLRTLFTVDEAVLEKAIVYARIMTPLGATLLLTATLTALLNSAKQFYVAGVSALGTPLTILVAILLLASQWGVEVAAWATVVGSAIELLVLALRFYPQRRTFLSTYARAGSEHEWWFWKSILVLSLASLVGALTPMVDQVFLSKLETGAISNFNYASKVNSLLIGIFGTAFSVAIYPYLSDLAAQRNVAGLKRLTLRLAAVVVPLTGIATVIVFIFSYELVDLLFARGNFTQTAVLEVGAIQQVFSLQLPLYVAGLMAMRVLNAVNASKAVLCLSFLTLACVSLFNWLLYQPMGASGIALSAVLTSLVGLIAAVLFIKWSFAYAGR